MAPFYFIILNKLLHLHLKVFSLFFFCTQIKKSNNKAWFNHWNFSRQWPLGRIHICVPGRNDVDGKQLCPLCFVKILSVWSVNTDTKPLGRAGEGNMSHNRMGLGSLLRLLWPLTVIGFQGCRCSCSLGAVSALIISRRNRNRNITPLITRFKIFWFHTVGEVWSFVSFVPGVGVYGIPNAVAMWDLG